MEIVKNYLLVIFWESYLFDFTCDVHLKMMNLFETSTYKCKCIFEPVDSIRGLLLWSMFAIAITTYNNGFPPNNPTHYRLLSCRLPGHVTILQWIPKSRPHVESPWKALRLLILLLLIDLTPETAVCWVTSPSVSPFTSPSPPIQHITITQTVTYPYFLTSNSNTVIYLLDAFKLDAKIINLSSNFVHYDVFMIIRPISLNLTSFKNF